ncbi:MAG: hypothetical protein HYV27_01875 [Candidatus Hydrogenedentes bacterium]|nr:hypothetical protein [Candidatus Hydrogenedentota bacterium]
MGLDAIEGTVLAAAQAQADTLLSEAQHAADSMLQAALDARRAELETQFQHEAQIVAQALAGQLAQARSEMNMEILARRTALLNGVFHRARLVALEWPPDVYRDVMKRLLTAVAPDRGGAVRVHPEEAELFEQILAALNASREEIGRLRVDPARPLDVRGGFIYDSGTFEVDRTLTTVSEELRDVLGPTVAARLFAPEGAAGRVHTPAT